MYGGTITENNADYGGGVYVKSGTFNMYGGSIKKTQVTGAPAPACMWKKAAPST